MHAFFLLKLFLSTIIACNAFKTFGVREREKRLQLNNFSAIIFSIMNPVLSEAIILHNKLEPVIDVTVDEQVFLLYVL